MRHTKSIIFAALSALTLISCSGISVDLAGEGYTYKDHTVDYNVSPKYEIGPSDVLDLTLMYSPVKSKALYIIQIGDMVRVEFPYYPEYDRSLLVRSDGYITLPLIGEIMAAGLSPVQLSLVVQKKQSNRLAHPHTTVTMEQINSVIEQFKQTMKSDDFGQSKIVKVRPDGYATIPLIGEMRFSGKLVSSVEDDIRSKYKDLLGNIEISLNIRSAESNVFYVMGWVSAPGFYQLTGPVTVMQGVAMAGGFRDEAQSTDVVLISRNKEKHPVGKIINIDNVIEAGNIANDSFLHQYDIIYVPPTALAKGAIIGREIWSIIPFRFSASYRLNDD